MADLVVEFGYNMQNALLIFCLLIATHLFAQTDDATVTAENFREIRFSEMAGYKTVCL